MKVVLQRVLQSSVTVNSKVVAKIEKGLLVFVGITSEDTFDDIQWLCKKIVNLRIFPDDKLAMNTAIHQVNGDIIVVSQFTLHASTKKGNRPSFIQAAQPKIAEPLYESFKKELAQQLGKPIQFGMFGADMQVELVNDGPVTISIDSKHKI